MSSIGAIGTSGNNPQAIFQQNLFNQIDSSGSGSITKGTLEQAVTSAGGSTQGADALFAQLDPGNTGNVTEQQFSQNLPAPPFATRMSAQMIFFQASGWPGSSGTSQGGNLAQNLFSQVDANGDGSLSKSELEQAVTAVGGTTQAADAFYAKLDPNGTGSVSEQQLAQSLQPPSPAGNTAQDALLALIESQWQGMSGAISGNTAQDALSALMQKFTSNSSCSMTGCSPQGTSAQNSIWSLLQSLSSGQTGNGSSGLDPLMALLGGGTNGSSGIDPLMSLLGGSTGGGLDPLMSLLSGASGLGAGSQSSLFAMMQASSTSVSSPNGSSSTAGAANSTNLAFAISMYQDQMNAQMFASMSGSASGGF